MNALLHEYGYLEGSPGDYSLTEKGKEYGSEQYQHRGNGGYAHYNAVLAAMPNCPWAATEVPTDGQ